MELDRTTLWCSYITWYNSTKHCSFTMKTQKLRIALHDKKQQPTTDMLSSHNLQPRIVTLLCFEKEGKCVYSMFSLVILGCMSKSLKAPLPKGKTALHTIPFWGFFRRILLKSEIQKQNSAHITSAWLCILGVKLPVFQSNHPLKTISALWNQT